MVLKFISDENIPIKLTELLREKGFDVKKAVLGSTDKEIFKFAKEESRIILTFDKHFLNKRLFNLRECPGIIFIQIHPPLIDSVFYSLIKLLHSTKDFTGKLFILFEYGFKIKE